MGSRLASCDPCRTSKLACDHVHPVCTRCRKGNRPEHCAYRDRPFVKRRSRVPSASVDRGSPRTDHTRTPNGSTAVPILTTTPNLDPAPARQGQYPNPGYLGESSHVTIFGRLTARASGFLPETIDPAESRRLDLQSSPELIDYGSSLLREIRSSVEVESLARFVQHWLAKGLSLPLSGLFLPEASEAAAEYWRNNNVRYSDDEMSRQLLRNTNAPLKPTCPSLPEYCSQFCDQQKVRWETLGFFFAAACRATLDMIDFPSLYETEKQRRRLREITASITDRCLELSLALDCLNDLQFCLQFENWVNYSHVEGDQGYRTWRRWGDVTSTFLALGYHENPPPQPVLPFYMRELRRMAFAEVYSTDKNVSIFLGRPPRLCKRFCQFQLPTGIDIYTAASEQQVVDETMWHPFVKPCYWAEVRWSAQCASLKEDILELLRHPQRAQQTTQISAIRQQVERDWAALPPQFRHETSLASLSGSAFEKGFLASTRLNYFHVLFLLQLLTLDRHAEPDGPLIEIARDILTLVVEMIVSRERLTNTGTALDWKVSYYGVPAAGIVCLFILRNQNRPVRSKLISASMLRNLGVLVTEIELGAIGLPGDANYALLSQAATTVRTMLDMILAGTLSTETLIQPTSLGHSAPQDISEPILDEAHWNSWNTADPWEFDFWSNMTGQLNLLGDQHQELS